MPKINRGYQSIRENFIAIWWDKVDKRRASPFEFRMAYLPSYRKNLDRFSIGTQYVGTFQPIVDAVYDAADTFRPYKSGKEVGWDLLQPLRGIGNTLEALLQILYIPLYIVAKLTFMNIAAGIKAEKGHTLGAIFGNTVTTFIFASSWLMNSVPKLLRGITQLATTPLSWLKMIARGFSTLENRGVQRLVEDRSIVRLVKQGEALQQDLIINPHQQQVTIDEPILSDSRVLKLDAIQKELSRKWSRAYQATQKTNKDNAHTNPRMSHLDSSKFKDGNWVSFFKTAMVDRKVELQEISRTRFGKSAPAA